VRLLKGQDPDPDKLEEDCERLEERLAEQEQKLLEKELILEEETRLTDRVSKKVFCGWICVQIVSSLLSLFIFDKKHSLRNYPGSFIVVLTEISHLNTL
jgi:hypothetical protein